MMRVHVSVQLNVAEDFELSQSRLLSKRSPYYKLLLSKISRMVDEYIKLDGHVHYVSVKEVNKREKLIVVLMVVDPSLAQLSV